MKRKYFLIGLFVFVQLLSFTACHQDSPPDFSAQSEPQMEASQEEIVDASSPPGPVIPPRFTAVGPIVGDGAFCGRSYVIIDNETKVMYLWHSFSWGNGGAGGLTVMVDANGKPLLYESPASTDQHSAAADEFSISADESQDIQASRP